MFVVNALKYSYEMYIFIVFADNTFEEDKQMKDGLICGVVIGMIAGALLYKYNPEAKQIINSTEKAVKKEVQNMKKQLKTDE